MAGSHEVRGSIPLCSTIYSKGSAFKRALFCVVPHSFGAILATPRCGIDDGNGANPRVMAQKVCKGSFRYRLNSVGIWNSFQSIPGL